MKIVGVRFQKLGRVHYFDPAEFDLAVDDKVLVPSTAGEAIASVVIAPHQILFSQVVNPLAPVLKKLNSGR